MSDEENAALATPAAPLEWMTELASSVPWDDDEDAFDVSALITPKQFMPEPTKPIKIVKVFPAPDAVRGPTIAEMKRDAYLLLNIWIANKKLIKYPSTEPDDVFLAKMKKALMQIQVLADDYNLTDSDLYAEDFVFVLREKYPRLIMTAKDVKARIEELKAEAFESKKLLRSTSGNSFESNMFKAFMEMQTPVVHPSDEVKSEIARKQTEQESYTRNAMDCYKDYLKYIGYGESTAREIRELNLKLESLKHLPAVDMFSELKAFCLKADGVNFPFKFKYSYAMNDGKHLFFRFFKPSFTYMNPDSGVPYIVPDSDIELFVQLESGVWKYSIRVRRPDDLNAMIRQGDYIYSQDGTRYFHAHVSSDGSICLGNAGDMIAKMRTQFNKVPDSLLIIDSLLKTYNPGSPYINLENSHAAYSMVLYRMVAYVENSNDGGFTTALHKQCVDGEISITEMIQQLADKMMQIYRFRISQMLNSGKAISVQNELSEFITSKSKMSMSSHLVTGMVPAFTSIEKEYYFIEHMRQYFYTSNLISTFYTRLNISRYDLYQGNLNLESADFFLDFMQTNFDHYVNYVRVLEANSELYYKTCPENTLCNELLSNIPFKEWFLTKRKAL